jgi:hypothetical protein
MQHSSNKELLQQQQLSHDLSSVCPWTLRGGRLNNRDANLHMNQNSVGVAVGYVF